SIFSKRHMDALNIGGQQLGIPAYEGTVQIVYRQDILDSLRLRLIPSRTARRRQRQVVHGNRGRTYWKRQSAVQTLREGPQGITNRMRIQFVHDIAESIDRSFFGP
ncbi:MAG: hypothetical protein OWV35_00775, partial [Firmicutes bacterium]|nr:hypothetical protein [Bacillota bacterium]